MRIREVLFRLYVEPENLEQQILFYETVWGQRVSLRFRYPELHLELAKIGPLLLIAGKEEQLSRVRATALTCVVDEIQDAKESLISKGAELLEDIKPVPTGWNMRVRHPDGTIVEYVQWR